MSNPIDTFQCQVSTDEETWRFCTMHVYADWCDAFRETDCEPEETAGYEITRAVLNVDADLRSQIERTLSIRIDGGIPIDADVLSTIDPTTEHVDVGSADLYDELAEYLMVAHG